MHLATYLKKKDYNFYNPRLLCTPQVGTTYKKLCLFYISITILLSITGGYIKPPYMSNASGTIVPVTYVEYADSCKWGGNTITRHIPTKTIVKADVPPCPHLEE